MNTIKLTDFLTKTEIRTAVMLNDRKAIRDKIIIPNLERINKALGQENDPDHLAYAIEYAMAVAGLQAVDNL